MFEFLIARISETLVSDSYGTRNQTFFRPGNGNSFISTIEQVASFIFNILKIVVSQFMLIGMYSDSRTYSSVYYSKAFRVILCAINETF